MAITVTINNLRIDRWTVDTALRNVEVEFFAIDSNGDTVGDLQIAFFWETLPDTVDEHGNQIPRPDNFYQLPPTYSSTLTNLTQDAKNALMHLINE